MRCSYLLQTLGLLLIIAASTQADPGSANRGIWFWGTPTSPYGADNIVGNNALENHAVAEFQQWGITHVYGSYGTRPETVPATIAAWNQKLSNNGVASDLLLSENTWIFPANRSGLMDKLQSCLIDFNNSQFAAGRFQAVHLDIEPQGLSQWSTWTSAQKRDGLNLLRDTYQDARSYLDTHGAVAVPIYADLPVWFDSLTAIGWSPDSERDDWFSSVGQSLAGISLMAYERPSFSSIDSSVQWERANFSGTVRVGLEADIGPGQTWSDLNAMMTIAGQVETNYGPSAGVDIHSYRLFEETVHAVPEPSTLILLATGAIGFLGWVWRQRKQAKSVGYASA